MKKHLFAEVGANKWAKPKRPNPIKGFLPSWNSQRSGLILQILLTQFKKNLLHKMCLDSTIVLNATNYLNFISRFMQRNWMIRPVAHCAMGALSE